MTNHEKFAEITGEEEPIEIEAVKILLEKILEDVGNGFFEINYDRYLPLYKSYIEWLNSEAVQK